MAIYSGGFPSTVATTTAPSLDLKASSTNSPRVMEWTIALVTALASTYGLGRPGNDGSVAQTSPSLLQAEAAGGPPAQSGTAVAWGTAPTVPTVFHRRVSIVAATGAGIIWTFPRGLEIAQSNGIVQWNLAANSASINVTVVCDE